MQNNRYFGFKSSTKNFTRIARKAMPFREGGYTQYSRLPGYWGFRDLSMPTELNLRDRKKRIIAERGEPPAFH